MGRWKVKPMYACVFGSAARGDGDADSDIDLLLVHPPVVGERAPSRMRSLKDFVGTAVMDVGVFQMGEPEQAKWSAQIDQLHDQVFRWTGNRLQVVSLSAYRWIDRRKVEPSLVDNIGRDAVELVSPGALLSTATRIGTS